MGIYVSPSSSGVYIIFAQLFICKGERDREKIREENPCVLLFNPLIKHTVFWIYLRGLI